MTDIKPNGINGLMVGKWPLAVEEVYYIPTLSRFSVCGVSCHKMK